MDDPLVNSLKLSEKVSKRLFFNAVNDVQVINAFAAAVQAPVPRRPEVNPVEAPINPLAALEARNAELDLVRRDLAAHGDSTTSVVRPPVKQTAETVSLEQLPAVVRQAAERAVLKRIAGK